MSSSQKGELDSDRSVSESESESDPDGSSDRITDSPSQENYITVDSTTIIVNAKTLQQSPSVCPQSRQQLPPIDISSGPRNLLLSQRFIFQHVPLDKADHELLTVNGIRASVGLSTRFSKM